MVLVAGRTPNDANQANGIFNLMWSWKILPSPVVGFHRYKQPSGTPLKFYRDSLGNSKKCVSTVLTKVVFLGEPWEVKNSVELHVENEPFPTYPIIYVTKLVHNYLENHKIFLSRFRRMWYNYKDVIVRSIISMELHC